MASIYFHEINIRAGLPQRRALKVFLENIFKRERKNIKRVDVIFCNDKFLRSLNKQFLAHDYETDTLSFLLSAPKEPIIGELYISIERIQDNANRYRMTYNTELLRVIIHSCLHLCGYTDKPTSAAGKMAARQEILLKEWFVSRETQ